MLDTIQKRAIRLINFSELALASLAVFHELSEAAHPSLSFTTITMDPAASVPFSQVWLCSTQSCVSTVDLKTECCAVTFFSFHKLSMGGTDT